MSGEGHRDWVSTLDFHPRGICLASGSGDATVRLWDFARAECVATLSAHTSAVWAVAFHDAGEFLASASLDHSVRLWDLTAGSCKLALRGHVDSVNCVRWLTCTNTLATASSDKTVSLWDARSGLTSATFYGHTNSVNAVAASLDNRTLASCDADGSLRVWDPRMIAERAAGAVAPGGHPLNDICIDRSGCVAALACDDGNAYTCWVGGPGAGGGGGGGGEQRALLERLAELSGHGDAVQAVAFDPAGEFAVTASADCTFKLWR